MQAVHINSSAAWGGLEQYTVYLSSELQNRGCTVVLACVNDSPLQKAAVKCNVPVVNIGPARHLNKGIFDLVKGLTGSSVLHIHTSVDMWSASIVARRRRIPIVFHSHMVPSNKNDLVHRMIYRGVNRFVTPAHLHAKAIPECYACTPERVSVIRHARPVLPRDEGGTRSRELRSTLNIADDAFVVGYLGRIDRQKGMVELLEAMKLISAQSPLPIVLLVVGSPSALFQQGAWKVESDAQQTFDWMQRFVQTNHLSHRVMFVPHLESMELVYPSIDVAILPSHREMFSLSVLEAMLAHKPVIGTNSGGTTEQLQDERGQLIPPRCAGAIAKAILTYATNQPLREEHARKAYEWALIECDEDVIMQQYISLYNELIRIS